MENNSMIPLQLIAIFTGITAIYLSFLYYKRKDFTKIELAFWAGIWIAFIFIALFPRSVSPIVGYLGLQRSMDLIMIIAFIILFSLAFHNYITNRKHRDKLEKLIRELALRDLEK